MSFDQRPVMEGKLLDTVPDTNYVLLKVNFTTTSYQLNRQQFRLRVTLFQKNAPVQSFFSTASITDHSSSPMINSLLLHKQVQKSHSHEKEESQMFVLEHDSFDPHLQLLASVLSPAFFIYSKKNHTKQTQRKLKPNEATIEEEPRVGKDQEDNRETH
jgi:hypothetical protein